jgi:excisionase family DNA binding protein
MTMGQPETYISASEAARLLGVSRQRVAKMVEDGDLIALRPWPGAIRIPMTAVEDWQAGIRRPGITKTAAMDYLLANGVTDPLTDQENALHLLAEYIEGVRPEWDEERKEAWITSSLSSFAPATS